MYEKMLLARRVRMVGLIVFLLVVLWQQMWLLVAIAVALIALTIWQTKRLREEIAVRTAKDGELPEDPGTDGSVTGRTR